MDTSSFLVSTAREKQRGNDAGLAPEERFESSRPDGCIIHTLSNGLRFFMAISFFSASSSSADRDQYIGLLALIEKLLPDHAVRPDPRRVLPVLIPSAHE